MLSRNMNAVLVAALSLVGTALTFRQPLPKMAKVPATVVGFQDTNKDVAVTSAISFKDIIGKSGFDVVKHDKVPVDFSAESLSINIPTSWYPTVYYSEAASKQMTDEFWAMSDQLGLFKVPGTVEAFEQLDIGEFGGSEALLQPGRNREGAFLVHEFTYVFAMWDDIIENNELLGLASIMRAKTLAKFCLKRGGSKHPAVFKLTNTDERDAPFLKYWVRHFDRAASVLSPSQLARYTEAFLQWCESLVDEIHSLHALDASEIDLEDQWQARIKSVAGFVFCPFLAAAAEFEPSEDFWEQPEVQRMEYLYTAILREVNELVSIPKDIVDGCGSLFTSTMLVDSKSVEDTIDHFVSRLSQSITEFDHLDEQLRARGGYEAGAEEYFDVLRKSATGIILWHLSPKENKRYTKVALIRPEDKIVYVFEEKPIESTNSVKLAS